MAAAVDRVPATVCAEARPMPSRTSSACGGNFEKAAAVAHSGSVIAIEPRFDADFLALTLECCATPKSGDGFRRRPRRLFASGRKRASGPEAPPSPVSDVERLTPTTAPTHGRMLIRRRLQDRVSVSRADADVAPAQRSSLARSETCARPTWSVRSQSGDGRLSRHVRQSGHAGRRAPRARSRSPIASRSTTPGGPTRCRRIRR